MVHEIRLAGYKATLPGGSTAGLMLGTAGSYGIERLQVVNIYFYFERAS